MQKTKSEILESVNHLLQLSLKGRTNFPDEICEFLVNQFDFQSVVLFNFAGPEEITVIGKSDTARKNFTRGSKFKCAACGSHEIKSDFSVISESNCEIQISEFVIYESCILFKFSNTAQGLLKIANKTPLSHADIEDLHRIANFIGIILEKWASESFSGNENTTFENSLIKTTEALRSSVNSIIGFTSILSEDNITMSQAEYVRTIKENSQELLLTLSDLNELAKIHDGKVSNEPTDTRLNILINEVVQIFKQKHTEKRIEYELNQEGDFSAPMKIDNQKLRSILNTLFTVATYLSNSDKILITLKRSSDKLISVNIGTPSVTIDSDAIASLFTPFAVNSIGALKKANITGLSLTLASQYARIIGGNLSVNKAASGLLFELKLSASKTSKDFSGLAAGLPKPTSLNKILVVEDDYATSKLLSNYLNKWGYEPTIVNSEEETLSLIEQEKFLAVILDIEIPNVNGLQLLRKINMHPKSKNTPVIVCSIETEQQKAYLMGAVEYFVKPINYNYLVEILTSYKLRKNSNILCVDDDVPTLNLIKQAIETAGYSAVAEHISANVMERIKDMNIDLAIIDLDMPHPNGFELIKLIKSEKKFEKLPIIIYTGKENFDEDLQQIDGLFEHLLSKKSTNIEDLAKTIEAMVNKAEIPPAEEVIKKSDGVKILLAEDYKHSQIIVTRLLKKNNFENIVVVENGEEAVNMANKEHFDLILMDMQMPIMNGFEATEKLRQTEEYKETPIIALTAFAMKGDREKCLAAGATDYIPKPIDSKEFIEKVKYYTSSN